MNLTDKQVGGLTLKMLSITPKMNEAKGCAVAALYALADRDVQWVNFIKDKYGIEFDFTQIRNQYEEAIKTVNGF